MARHLYATVNGVELTNAVPTAIISQIQFDPAESDLSIGDRAGGWGQRVLSMQRKSLHVGIEFVIRELYDLAARARATEAAAAWAQNGRLEISNMPDRFLMMHCTGRPTVQAARDYTQVMKADFTAYAVPFWQDTSVVSLTLTGSQASGVLRPTGTVDRIPICATVTPSNSTLTTLTLTVGNTAMQFTGLSVTPAAPLMLRYTDDHILVITSGGAGQMSHRTGSDELLAVPGAANSVSFTANTECSVKFEARGLYL